MTHAKRCPCCNRRRTVAISGLLLRARDGNVELLVERGGRWLLVATRALPSPRTAMLEPHEIVAARPDPVTADLFASAS